MLKLKIVNCFIFAIVACIYVYSLVVLVSVMNGEKHEVKVIHSQDKLLYRVDTVSYDVSKHTNSAIVDIIDSDISRSEDGIKVPKWCGDTYIVYKSGNNIVSPLDIALSIIGSINASVIALLDLAVCFNSFRLFKN